MQGCKWLITRVASGEVVCLYGHSLNVNCRTCWQIRSGIWENERYENNAEGFVCFYLSNRVNGSFEAFRKISGLWVVVISFSHGEVFNSYPCGMSGRKLFIQIQNSGRRLKLGYKSWSHQLIEDTWSFKTIDHLGYVDRVLRTHFSLKVRKMCIQQRSLEVVNEKGSLLKEGKIPEANRRK